MSKSNFITINSTFKPLTYEQVMKPLEDATKAHLEAQAVYDKISAQATDVLSMLNPETDKEQIDQYKQFMQQIEGGVDDLNKNGYNIGTLNNLSKIYRGYGEVINPIEKAYQRRAEIAKTQFDAKQKDPSYYPQFDASATPLGEFMNNPSLMPKSFSGAAITKDVEDTMKNFAKLYNEGASNVDFTEKEGKILKGLFTTGLTPEDVIDMISSIGDSKNHDYDNILMIINDAVNKTGVNEWNNPKAYNSAVESALRGLYGGLGTSSLQSLTSGGGKSSSSGEDGSLGIFGPSAISYIPSAPSVEQQRRIMAANGERLESGIQTNIKTGAVDYAQSIIDDDQSSEESKKEAKDFIDAVHATEPKYRNTSTGAVATYAARGEQYDAKKKIVDDYIKKYEENINLSSVTDKDFAKTVTRDMIKRHPETGINPDDKDAKDQYVAYQLRSLSLVKPIEMGVLESSQPEDDRLINRVRGYLSGYTLKDDDKKKQMLVDSDLNPIENDKYEKLVQDANVKVGWDNNHKCLMLIDGIGNKYYFGVNRKNWKTVFDDLTVILPAIEQESDGSYNIIKNDDGETQYYTYGVSDALQTVSKYATSKLAAAKRNTSTINKDAEEGVGKYITPEYNSTVNSISNSYNLMMEAIFMALISENNNFFRNKSKSSSKSDEEGGEK